MNPANLSFRCYTESQGYGPIRNGHDLAFLTGGRIDATAHATPRHVALAFLAMHERPKDPSYAVFMQVGAESLVRVGSVPEPITYVFF